ncbi:flagellar biosynthesis protein FlhB [Ferrovibrio sp.]|uniref:flagellar biosynthesis protein FlhB n=1 Tax=Ferrovibrio sp. TaxID=1917215 RepID=UPI00311DE3F7
MAEDADQDSKTEEPTEKRIQEAEKKGNIARSQEIGHWFIFMASAIALWTLGDLLQRQVVGSTRVFFERPHQIPIDISHLTRIGMDLFLNVGIGLSPVLGLIALFSLAGNFIQNPPKVSVERIVPKFSKLNPLNGLKRMFAASNMVEFIKNLLKITVIGIILFALIMPEMDSLEALVDLDLTLMIPLTLRIVAKLIVALLAIMFVVGAADYLYQRFNYLKQLRMTTQELKDEYKESEGDPMIKARLRQIRMQRVRKRMMAAVPEASVVVTNPTHFAVALKYEAEKMDAPRVVAKGADLLAKRIREIATENKVPIIENPPLARALYKVEIDDPIPLELYRAVAGVISYIMRLKDGIKATYQPDPDQDLETIQPPPGRAR